MTKLQVTIISLTLIGSLAVMPVRAQTDATKQPDNTTALAPPPNSQQPQKSKRRHAARTPIATKPGSQSGVKPATNEMQGMPGMEGMQHGATPQQEQQSKPPKT